MIRNPLCKPLSVAADIFRKLFFFAIIRQMLFAEAKDNITDESCSLKIMNLKIIAGIFQHY